MKLYRTADGYLVEQSNVEQNNRFYVIELDGWNADGWDCLVTRPDLSAFLDHAVQNLDGHDQLPNVEILAPIGSQEVWAAGVTYHRSRDARMEESKSVGGGDFYDRVYSAERPELFFKSTAHRVVGPNDSVAIRDDASWSVPEPELTLLISPEGKIIGYTVGNDMSSRDIEGENPLYLPQAKVYDRSCALGPCILVSEETPASTTEIRLQVVRGGRAEFEGATTLESLKRDPKSLVQYLYRNNSFPKGCFLMTGTGIVPPDDFTLKSHDEIRISITGIGTLVNRVG